MARVRGSIWRRREQRWSEAQIVDAAFVITTYIAVSKFGDAPGVELEDMVDGGTPKLPVNH